MLRADREPALRRRYGASCEASLRRYQPDQVRRVCLNRAGAAGCGTPASVAIGTRACGAAKPEQPAAPPSTCLTRCTMVRYWWFHAPTSHARRSPPAASRGGNRDRDDYHRHRYHRPRGTDARADL